MMIFYCFQLKANVKKRREFLYRFLFYQIILFLDLFFFVLGSRAAFSSSKAKANEKNIFSFILLRPEFNVAQDRIFITNREDIYGFQHVLY